MKEIEPRKVAWVTDLHLDFIGEEGYGRFVEQVQAQEPDVVLLSGDIAVSNSLIEWLEALKEDLPGSLYFVLGNHDYYGSTFESIHQRVHAFCERCPDINWLTEKNVIPLTRRTALIGHEGWADGQEGDYWNSRVRLRDYQLIMDFIGLEKGQQWDLVREKGQASAAILREKLIAALECFPEVIMVIHPPPFRESSCYDGHPANDEWAPHFVCQAIGRLILEVMPKYPESRLLVLCGHSHHWADYRPLENVQVLTGHAEYGNPLPQAPIHIH